MQPTSLSPEQVQRALGAVVASAAGDALGAPYEFGPPALLAPCAMEGGGTFDWAPGEWTDDTQQSVAVLDGLAYGPIDGPEHVAHNLLAWYASRPADVGNQTRAVLDAASSGTEVAEAAIAFQAQNPQAAGNGALMRTGAVALVAPGDRAAVAAAAREVSALTHPHPDSTAACVLWSVAIADLVENGLGARSFSSVVAGGLDLLAEPSRQEWSARIDSCSGLDPASLHLSNGWVVDAFRAALACCETTGTGEPLRDGLSRAARAGGDTDTVAAIAGALLGAAYGIDAVPGQWVEPLHGRRRYGENPLGADDLVQLTLRLLGGS